MNTTTFAALTSATLLCTVACAQPSGPAADLGPMTYDASGTMPCSAGEPSYDQACGWRVLRKADGGAELWIANIAVSDRAVFRVLRFSDGEIHRPRRRPGPGLQGRRYVVDQRWP